jgi:predicted DNA-binding protein (MmcQ/YjbR family)
MDLEQLMEVCAAMPHSTHDIKWENHLCYNIGGKMFIIISLDTQPVTASFKVSDEDFYALSALPYCIPAPYLARYNWILTKDISLISNDEWQRIVQQAYSLVLQKLPKKVQEQIV